MLWHMLKCIQYAVFNIWPVNSFEIVDPINGWKSYCLLLMIISKFSCKLRVNKCKLMRALYIVNSPPDYAAMVRVGYRACGLSNLIDSSYWSEFETCYGFGDDWKPVHDLNEFTSAKNVLSLSIYSHPPASLRFHNNQMVRFFLSLYFALFLSIAPN